MTDFEDMDRDERVLAYLQDRLAPDARASFERQIGDDPGLGAEIAMLRSARQVFAEEVPVGNRSAGWDRLSAAIDADRPAAANTNRPVLRALAQAAAVAVIAVALWQVAVVPRLGGLGVEYRTVTEAAEGPRLQVSFAGDATMADVAELLNEVGAIIVDGPGARGIYRLSFTDDAGLQAAVERLQARPDLVDGVFAP